MRSPWEIYRKADWNFARYEDAVFARPSDAETIVYTALDFCIAIVALRDWTWKRLARDMREGRGVAPAGVSRQEEFLAFVAARVRWQPAIEAIANTSKHAEYRDIGWEKGVAAPASFFPENLRTEHDACADGAQLLAFMHRHHQVTWWDLALRQHGQENATPGYEALGDALDQWGEILTEFGFRED